MTKKAQTGSATLPDRILVVAEELFAEHGLTGVSLRQISTAAGARNTNAVQYHFGNTEGLLRSILERHAPVLEMQRAGLLAEYAAKGRLKTPELLKVLYRPILDTESGQAPTSARFFLALLAAKNGWEPLTEVFQRLPVSRQVFDLITEANQPVPPSITWQRILYSGIALLTYAVNASNISPTRAYYEAAVSDAFAMVAAGLGAPVQPDAPLLAVELQKYFSE